MSSLNGQDYGWWNQLVQWDGKTSWQGYLQLSAAGLGPNALPVPDFNSNGVEGKWSFTNQLRHHFHEGDPTTDLFTRLDYAFSSRIAIAMWMVPLEYYNTATATRNKRQIREFEPQGYTTGDFYFGTYFHLLEESDKRPDVVVSANIKTASGNNIEGGRVTDTPGYYFDVLLAKTFGHFRPYIGTGLYVYQTYDDLHFQNDAILYALGFYRNFEWMSLQCEWAGYWGYLDIGDRPSVLRANVATTFDSTVNWNMGMQVGVQDFNYTTLSLGIIYTKK
jgi:hypothetical protein